MSAFQLLLRDFSSITFKYIYTLLSERVYKQKLFVLATWKVFIRNNNINIFHTKRKTCLKTFTEAAANYGSGLVPVTIKIKSKL